MNMKTAIVTVGISASGKSTFAREWVEADKGNRIEINRDNIRRHLAEFGGGLFSWDTWKWNKEGEVTRIADDMFDEAARAGDAVIISDTNLNPKYRAALIAKLNLYGYEVEVMDFPISIEEAWKRDAKRADGVGHSVIAKQHDQWLEYVHRFANAVHHHPTYVPDVTKPKCILVDIDGTAAHMNGKRGAFDWDKVHLDDVDHAVKLVVAAYKSTGNKVIFLSERDGICELATRQWLNEHDFQFDELIMRKPNDMRKDTIVKEEIFWHDIAPNYNVQFVIDDRPSVCRMWRRIGLKVFQVGNTHIEF